MLHIHWNNDQIIQTYEADHVLDKRAANFITAVDIVEIFF